MSSIETIRSAHKLASNSIETVEVISARAGDNAADTVGYSNRFDADGCFTDAFLFAWAGTVADLLSDAEATDADRAWFAAHGINF